jgi:peptidoglycan/LPS O-acetylase OafA/YrhL
VVAWALLATVVEAAGLRSVVGVYFALCVVGILAGVAMGTFLARSTVLVRIGSSTLPVYLGHTPIIILASSLVIALTGVATSSGALGLLVVPAAAAAAVALSWLVHRWTASGPLRYLYAVPDRLSGERVRGLRPSHRSRSAPAGRAHR